MALRRRTTLGSPGTPEIVGAGLVLLAMACAVIALTEYHTPHVDKRAALVSQGDGALTEEALRRVLRDVSVSFHYAEENLAEQLITVENQDSDGFVLPGSGSIVRISQGDGGMEFSVSAAQAPQLLRSAGLQLGESGGSTESRSWALAAAVVYVMALYYFATAYPAWRRRGVYR